MVRNPYDATEAEQAVLEVLWSKDMATIRHLTDELYPNGTASNFSTVQKLLERLEGKGFVERERRGSANWFRPLVDRQELIGRRLSAVAESLCDGSLTPLLQHLVEAHDLTSQDRESLQMLIEKFDERKFDEKKKTKKKDR
jgi:predicted transcriptional regulator